MESVSAFLKGLFPAQCHNRVFLVGGIVRDFLLGVESQDIDLAAALPAERLVALGFRLVEGKSTAPIYFKHYSGFGKIEVTMLADPAALHDDLSRRDFTCNAMAMALTGELIDPLGGRADMEQRQLRACSKSAFRDDPLRIFRAFRFEAEGWRMTPQTEALIREQGWDEALSRIPVERFSRELLKALEKGEPERFFLRMLEFSVGTAFLPELFRMPHIPAGPVEHHPEGDLFTHSIQVLQRVAALTPDATTRFCAMFHDIGKLATEPALYPKHHGHDEAGFKTAQAFCNRLCLSALLRKALAWTSRLHIKANRWGELRDSTRIEMAEQALKSGIAEILPLVSGADRPGAGGMAGWHEAVRVARMTTVELGIDQERLLAMAPEDRPSFVLQKQVESLGGLRRGGGAADA